MENPIRWMRNILKDRALRKESLREQEILRKDRLICPPELPLLEGIPLGDYKILRVWSVGGNSYNRLKRESLIPEAEETKLFIGHVLHEEGGVDDKFLLSMPIILVADKKIATRIVAPLMAMNVHPEEAIRHTYALVTLGLGWAVPFRSGQRDRPSLPWKYLLHQVDYERIVAKNRLAFWLALGYRPPEDKTKNVEPI